MLQPGREKRKSTGNVNSTVRSFYSNKNVSIEEDKMRNFIFDVPQFSTFGGTVNYYSQEPAMLFTNINTPFIRYVFTANTHSLSGAVEVIHRTYKLDFGTFSNYNPFLNKSGTDGVIESGVTRQREIVFDESGNKISEKTTVLETGHSAQTQNFKKVDLTTFAQVQELMQDPFLEDTVYASGITKPTYDYFPGQFIKTTGTTAGNYKKQLFEDKGQYFVATSFKFYEPTLSGDSEIQAMIDVNTGLEDLYYNGYTAKTIDDIPVFTSSDFYPNDEIDIFDLAKPRSEFYETSVSQHTITANTFNGVVVQGNFFTYFTVPNKPKIEEPIISGAIDTFTPQIVYSNVDDGDSSIVEVVYDVNDTGFTTEKFSFKIDKNLDESGLQFAGIPLKTGQNFRYRVGNVKSIRNVFEVDQKLISFSDQLTGSTPVDSTVLAVIGENDSPFVQSIGDQFVPPSLTAQTSGGYSLSGVVSGSIVTGATITLTYQNGSESTIQTDGIGMFQFTGLTSGAYTLTTTYRGYKENVKNITISDNLELNYCIEILWDNEYETWEIKDDDIIKY